jgi:branched-chain amino acid transport system permease protein
MTEARRKWLYASLPTLVVAVFLGVFPTFGGNYYTHILILIFLNITLVLGYRLLCLTGLYSFCHISFFAIGAYTSALLSTKAGFPVWLAFIASGFVAAFFSVLLIMPAARVRGVYFFLVSFGFLGVMDSVFTNWTSLTGGSAGVVGIPSLIGAGTFTEDYYLILAFAVIAVVVMYRLEKTRFGRELMPIGQAEGLAAVSGINVLKDRVLAFSIGAALAGFAGSLFAHDAAFIAPTNFTMWGTIYILVWLVIGGQRKIWGPIAGAVVMTLIAEFLRNYGMWQALFYSVALLLAILAMPQGIVGVVDKLRAHTAKGADVGPDDSALAKGLSATEQSS